MALIPSLVEVNFRKSVMSVLQTRITQALEELDKPSNEPLKWLLGRFISTQAKRSFDSSIFHVLAGDRKHQSEVWNYWIDQYRKSLTNPEEARQKADGDLSAGSEDADEKLRSFMSEVFAVIRLKDRGYKNITAILPDDSPKTDYHAEFRRKKVRIEVCSAPR
jgi:hypothetical protein